MSDTGTPRWEEGRAGFWRLVLADDEVAFVWDRPDGTWGMEAIGLDELPINSPSIHAVLEEAKFEAVALVLSDARERAAAANAVISELSGEVQDLPLDPCPSSTPPNE